MRSTMLSRIPCVVATALCAIFVLAAPLPASAQPKKPGHAKPAAPKPLSATLTGPAKAEYDGGILVYQDGDYANALLKFQRAFELSKDPRLLWNIAACEKSLRRYTRVLAAVERYQKEGGALLTDQDRQDADELTKTIRTLVGTMTVTVDEPDADVFVDDEKVGASPLAAPVLLDAGDRKVRVVKPGFKVFEQTTLLGGAGSVTVAVKLQKEIHEGHLVVEAGPRDAITIDGKVVAAGRWEGVLPSGGHTLRVTAPDKVAYQSEVVIQDAQTRRVPITLEAVKSSFPLKPVLIGSGGVVVAAIAVAVAVVLTRPKPIDGSVNPPGLVSAGFVGFHFGGSR